MPGGGGQTVSCDTDRNGDRCFARASASVLGANNRPLADCSGGFGFYQAKPTGPDGIRRVACEITLTIEPAETLRPLIVDDLAWLYAPDAGTLTVADGTVFAIPGRASAAALRVPAI